MEIERFKCTGSLENIKHHAKNAFNNNHDQQVAFTQIVTAFVLKLHDKCSMTQNQSRKRNHQGHLLNQRTDDNTDAMKKQSLIIS